MFSILHMYVKIVTSKLWGPEPQRPWEWWLHLVTCALSLRVFWQSSEDLPFQPFLSKRPTQHTLSCVFLQVRFHFRRIPPQLPDMWWENPAGNWSGEIIFQKFLEADGPNHFHVRCYVCFRHSCVIMRNYTFCMCHIYSDLRCVMVLWCYQSKLLSDVVKFAGIVLETTLLCLTNFTDKCSLGTGSWQCVV